MSNFTWLWPWMALVGTVCALAALLMGIHMGRRKRGRTVSSKDGRPPALVWSLGDDLDTESGSRYLRQWRVLGRIAAVLLAACLILAISLAARPARVDKTREEGHSRDIVLCLDVSGSTLPYDREVLTSYLNLVKGFRGERMALSIFNSTSRTVFPLTDDYDMVTGQLEKARKVLDGVQSQEGIDKMTDRQYQAVSDWLEGTQNRKDATSLIGDGLVSCAAMLPGFSTVTGPDRKEASGRKASVVLATDNVLSGTSTYSLKEALDLAAEADISVDGLYSGPRQSEGDESTLQMRSLIEAHGGTFLPHGDQDSIDSLVRRIERRHGGDPDAINRSGLVDSPAWWVLALSICFGGYLLVAWRLRR